MSQTPDMAQFAAHPDRDSFAEEFTEVGSTIRYPDRFAYHARTILVDDRNYLGLFALDTLLNNRDRTYRRCDITVKANHPLVVFYQIQSFHIDDQNNLGRESKYLPDRPDLDKVVAILHDEGEDIKGYSREFLVTEMHRFIDNISAYVEQHNQDYPDLQLPQPTEEQIIQMRADVGTIALDYDKVTKNYKGQPKNDEYHGYHHDILDSARACRIKACDKPTNIATLAYRNREMLEGKNPKQAMAEYREWVHGQYHKTNDIYFNQNYLDTEGTLTTEFNSLEDSGFLNAAMQIHPSSARMINVMRDVMKLQLRLYSNDIANEGGRQNSPIPPIRLPEYDDIALSPRVNLLQITKTRLEEVQRIDALGENRPKGTGMFGIKFPPKRKRDRQPSTQPVPLMRLQAA